MRFSACGNSTECGPSATASVISWRMGGQAVHHDDVGAGALEQLVVDLELGKDGLALFGLGFLAHAVQVSV